MKDNQKNKEKKILNSRHSHVVGVLMLGPEWIDLDGRGEGKVTGWD